MRQAMPGIIVLLVASPAAQAASYRTLAPATACIDATATILLGDAALMARRSDAWRAATRRAGNCVAIEPGDRWERILASGPVMLLRRVPPEPGLPPLYFRRDALVPVVATPDAPAMAASPSGDAASTAATPASDPIRIEPLPALSPSTPPGTTPMPAVPEAAAQSDADTSLTTVTTNAATLESAMHQGYVVGFVAAMLLLLLLLTIVAGTVWAILRNLRAGRDSAFPGLGPQAAALGPAHLPTPMREIARAAPSGGPSRRSDQSRLPDAASGGPQVPVPSAALPPVPSAALPPVPSAALPPVPSAALPPVRVEAMPPVAPPPPPDAPGYRDHCLSLLDACGWQTSLHDADGPIRPHMAARRDARVLVLQCLPGEPAVDEEAVEAACMARERRQADIAVIVSNASCTAAAKRLSVQTGVVLLHEDELRGFCA